MAQTEHSKANKDCIACSPCIKQFYPVFNTIFHRFNVYTQPRGEEESAPNRKKNEPSRKNKHRVKPFSFFQFLCGVLCTHFFSLSLSLCIPCIPRSSLIFCFISRSFSFFQQSCWIAILFLFVCLSNVGTRKQRIIIKKVLKLNIKKSTRESKIIASSNDELPRQRKRLQLLTYSSSVHTRIASKTSATAAISTTKVQRKIER